MKCPCCHSDTMLTHEYESVEIERCKTCLGVWLRQAELTTIVENRTLEFNNEEVKTTIKMAFAGMPTEEVSKDLRHCPDCNKELNAINYSYNSGIIIDACPDGHGLWFDKNELENVQQYREYWHDNVKEHQESLTKMIENIKEEPTQTAFHSLLFNLSMEAVEIMAKFKKK